MGSNGHYSTCKVDRPYFGHQDSRTLLLRDTSVSSDIDDDAVFFQEETPSADLSIRSGSDQADLSAASFNSRAPLSGRAVVFPRRISLEGRLNQNNPPNGRRHSLQDRPLPRIPPTPYINVNHQGRVQNETTRSASVPCESSGTSSKEVQPPVPQTSASKPKSWKKRDKRCILFAFVICLLSIGSSVLSIVTYKMAKDAYQDYCLPCSDLTHPPNSKGMEDYQLSSKVVDGQEMCCVNSSDGLTRLVGQIQHYDKINFALSQNMTSAHVGLYADKRDTKAKSIQGGTFYTLRVSTEPSLQHCQNVIAERDRLEIVITGRYFIYSGIHFNLVEYGKVCKELAHQTWLHHVYRNRKSTEHPTAMLRSEHTCCDECEEERTSGFTGGVFELYTGDEIFVDVSAPPLVIDTKQTSYLGLFLVDTMTNSK